MGMAKVAIIYYSSTVTEVADPARRRGRGCREGMPTALVPRAPTPSRAREFAESRALAAGGCPARPLQARGADGNDAVRDQVEGDMMNQIREETRSGGRAGAPRSRRPVQAGAIVGLLGAWTVSALAQIVVVGGDAVLFTPNSVVQDQNESDTSILAFDENQCFTLKDDLETDQGTIPAGTSVSCHMMRADPANPPQLFQGTAVFDGPILGVISDSGLLDDSDDPCGLAGTTYPAPGLEMFRGLEAFQPTDQYRRVQGDCGLQVQMDVPSFQDQIRIITECCEEGEDCCGD